MSHALPILYDFATSWKDTHHIVLLAMIRDHLAGDRYPAPYPEYRDFSKAALCDALPQSNKRLFSCLALGKSDQHISTRSDSRGRRKERGEKSMFVKWDFICQSVLHCQV